MTASARPTDVRSWAGGRRLADWRRTCRISCDDLARVLAPDGFILLTRTRRARHPSTSATLGARAATVRSAWSPPASRPGPRWLARLGCAPRPSCRAPRRCIGEDGPWLPQPDRPSDQAPSNPRIKVAARLRDRTRARAWADPGRRRARGPARPRRRGRGRRGVRLRAAARRPGCARGPRCAATAGTRSTPTTQAAFAKIAFGDRAEGLVAVVRTPVDGDSSRSSCPTDAAGRRRRGRREAGQPRRRAAQRRRRRSRCGHRRLAADRPRQPERDPGQCRHGLRVPLAAAPTAEVLAWLRAHGDPDRRRAGRRRAGLHRCRPDRPAGDRRRAPRRTA